MYGQSSSTGDESGEMTPEEKSKKRNEFQREMVMLESDHRKKVNEKNIVDAEIRNFKKKEKRIKADAQVAQERLKHLDQEVFTIENDLRALKKKRNLIY